MKLATFEYNQEESWGIVINNPFDNRMWVFEPEKVEYIFSCSVYRALPAPAPKHEWPKDLVGFLELGEFGMERLRQLESALLRYLKQSDQYYITLAGHPLEDVVIRAPIPRPRLMWGLVSNSPSFWRNDPDKLFANLVIYGHQRPVGSIVGHNQIFLHAAPFNVELGVIIGKKGKNIPVEEAFDYIAGYTVVIDSQINDYCYEFDPDLPEDCSIGSVYNWYASATCSWGGKKSDAHCAVGPYLVTRDEVCNPYDLLVYTGQNGFIRDRSHTAGMCIGVERTIHWYSTFATLYPGDVIHMGTMGIDGILIDSEMKFGRDDFIEAEIERIGVLRARVLDDKYGDWRTGEEKNVESVVPAVRDFIRAGKQEIYKPQDWNTGLVNNVWTCFVNYKTALEVEGRRPAPSPCFLNGPNSSVAPDGSVLTLAKRATTIDIGVELAVVIKKMTFKGKKEAADEYILGYMPMISISDRSFLEKLIEPASARERAICAVYARWGDGYNIVGSPVKLSDVGNLKMKLTVEGFGEVESSTDEYMCMVNRTVEFISSHITLFPGDVITSGRTAGRITIPCEQYRDGIKITASIEGLGEINTTLAKE